MKYDIDSNFISTLHHVFARMRSEDNLKALRIKHGVYLTENGTLVTLVKNGFHDLAAALLNQNKGGLQNDYDSCAYFDEELETNIPSFLDKIDDPHLQYYAQVALNHAPDAPLPIGQRRSPPYPRNLRMKALAPGVVETKIEGTLRDKVLAMMVNYNETLPFLDEILAEAFEETDFERIKKYDSSSQMREALVQPFKYAQSQFERNNPEPAIKIWTGLKDRARSNYCQYQLRDFTSRLKFYDAVRNKDSEAVVPRLKFLRHALETGDEEMLKRTYSLPTYYILLSSFNGDHETESAWFEGLPAAKQKLLTDIARGRSILGYFNSLTSHQDSNLDGDEKLAFFKRINAHPMTHMTIHSNDSLFRRSVSTGVFTFDQIQPELDEMAATFPRKGFAYLDMAILMSEQKRWDDAMAYCQAARESKPNMVGRNQRVSVYEAKMLHDAGKNNEAVKKIGEVEINRLPMGARKFYQTVCKAIGVEPQKPKGKKG